MIVATAGHVDHGKTLLVKALTGIDTDRLPEEKRRGMTIDLGFAYAPGNSDTKIGFIDVPGHERFIHNMLCGVAGIDFVLFVVAVDDGPMPQTREHLAILNLLDVSEGAIVLTKIDRVPRPRIDEIAGEVKALLAETGLAQAPQFPVSAVSGAGIAELKTYLERAARTYRRRPANGNFRMPVDRCFAIAGAGLVVTGTAMSGSIAVGEVARTLLGGTPVRIRSVHAQNAPGRMGCAGQRCALNLSGLRTDRVERGDWIVTGDVPPATRKLDARLRVLPTERWPVAHWTPVHFHLGAADVTGRVAVLTAPDIAPGDSAMVQLVLDRPVGAVHGDRYILRDQSATRTIGGGQIIDVFAPVRGRAKPGRLASLTAMEENDHAAALERLLESGALGLNLSRFAANRNLTAEEAAVVFARARMRAVATAAGQYGYSPPLWDRLKTMALDRLAAAHRGAPDHLGVAEDKVLSAPDVRVPQEVSSAIVAELAREGRILKSGMMVRLAGHRPRLSPADAALWQKIAPLLETGGIRPPTVRQISEAVRGDFQKVESLLVRATRHGLVVRISPNRFVRPAALRQLGEIAEAASKASADQMVTAAAFRDRSGIGRDFSIETLEFFDRMKFTRRVGDAHQLLRAAAEVFSDLGSPSSTEEMHGRESHPGGAPGLQTR